MGFQFFHSVLLWGLGLVLLPILIHLLRRRLVRRYRLPTFEFLLRTQRRLTSRSRLRNWLLLLLRVSAVVIAVFLSSRPLMRMAGGESGSGWSPLHLVLVVDNSASMAYHTPRGTRLELAKGSAERMIRRLSSSDKVTVLATVEEAGEAMPPTLGKEAALERLRALGRTDAGGDPARAIQRAMESLTVPADRQSVVVLSDFARGDWEKLRLRGIRNLRPHTHLQFVRVAPEAGRDDVAIQNVHLRPWPPRAGAPFTVAVRVANRGRAPREQIPVTLFVGETKVSSLALTLAAGEEGTVSFRTRAPQEGNLLGRVEIGADALETTNQYHFAAAMGQRLRVLMVDGDPQRGLLDSDTYYLATALRAAPPGGDSPILVDVVAGYELGQVKWENYEFVVACNVGSWPPEAVERVRRFVDEGGGLLLAGGDLAGRTVPGEGWLPALPGAPRPVGASQRMVVPAEQHDHPVFALLGGNPGRFFSRVRIGKASPLEPVRGGRVLLALSDGTPLLVLGSSGAGRVAMWGSTCDRDWTDFPVRPAFVPFLRGLVDFVGGRAKGVASSLEAGQTLEVRAQASRAGEAVQIRIPGGEEAVLRLEPEGGPHPVGAQSAPQASPPAGAAIARYARTFRAGFYQVLTPEGTQVVAVNVPASEGQLEPLSDSELRGRLPEVNLVVGALRAEEENPARAIEGRMDLGILLFFLLASVLIFEGVVADRS